MPAPDAEWWPIVWESPETKNTWASTHLRIGGDRLYIIDKGDRIVVEHMHLLKERVVLHSRIELRCYLLACAYPEGNTPTP